MAPMAYPAENSGVAKGGEGMKRVFIVSPFGGSEYNRETAEWLCMIAIKEHGVAPFAAHLLYPQFLDESKSDERDLGIRAGLSWMTICDEVWVFADRGVSDGMKIEINTAEVLKKPIFNIDIQGNLTHYKED